MDRQRAPAWARTLLQPLLLGTPTHASAIAPYVMLRDGGTCTEQRRADSERLLRRLPYIADASVRVFDDSVGTVRIEVETVDDIRPVIGIGLRNAKLNDLELGNANIGGRGHLAAVRWRDGRAFRDGVGFRYADYHVLDGPNVAMVNVSRTPLGSFTQMSLGRPFYTDEQHAAGFVGYVNDNGYAAFVRPQGDPLSVRASRERADAGVAFRINTVGKPTYLVGALTSVERRAAGGTVVLISDSGKIDTTNAALTGRYATQQSTRAGLVFGLTALSFAKVRAFDGLEGIQDVGRGLQIATTIGKGIAGSDKRPFATLDVYTGVGNTESFVGLRVQGEARERGGRWRDDVISGRLAWYNHPSQRQTMLIALEYVGASSDSVPYQLAMNDALSGMRGFADSRLSGGRRLIARAERRILMPGISRYVGWGLAGFVDAGQMWATNVPFGATASRASGGLSVIAAVPRQSRSVARLDIAYPLTSDPHAKGFDIRVTYRVAARAFWREPGQLARARLSSPTTDVFSWP